MWQSANPTHDSCDTHSLHMHRNDVRDARAVMHAGIAN